MTYDRRRFLASASAAAFVVAAHDRFAWALPPTDSVESAEARAESRISGLKLLTAAPLASMKEFYHGRLGLPVLGERGDTLTIGGGATPITFKSADPAVSRPFYHFAFNIPENKIRGARAWQLDRSELLPIPPPLRDPDFPIDVVHFRHWNAHSVFFLDPAENVVEYIARHDMGNGAPGPFGVDDILYASEIAFVVDDVPVTAADMQDTFDLGRYGRGGEAFHALGDERGLLLVFKRGRNLSFGRPDAKLADVFPTAVTIRGTRAASYRAAGLPYEISSGGSASSP